MSNHVPNNVPLETSGTVVEEQPAGFQLVGAEYDMPSKNYFNHINREENEQ